ncbi:hypothetical protein B0H13DRAFT_1853072 [Mycena leptocephala]|nr:hypothetical protein B0H13DRAFT_1853072 [Mycena leptocephala]
MHFTRTFSSLVLFALGAVQVQAAAAPGADSSLTKRNWCGFDSTCSCTPGPKCELTLDTCSGEYFWPTTCTGCEPYMHPSEKGRLARAKAFLSGVTLAGDLGCGLYQMSPEQLHVF